MKKNIQSLIIILIIVNNLYAQGPVLRGFVYSKSTGEALEFANVYFKKINNGTYTNKFGFFELSNSNIIDTLIISYIGHQDLKIASTKFEAFSDTLFLENRDILLPEVIISNKIFNLGNSRQIGYVNSKKTNFISSGSGVQFAVLISNPNITKSTTIKGVSFLVKNKSLWPLVVKIHLYKNLNNSPGEELTKSEIVEIIDSNPPLKYSVDLNKFNILFPADGLYLGIEWVGVYHNNKINPTRNEYRDSQLGYTFEYDTEYTWKRFMRKPWEKVSKKDFPESRKVLNCAFSVLY